MSVGVQPAIAVNESIKPGNSELVEINTELFGLNTPFSYTIKLSNEDSEKIDKIFEEIDTKISSSESIDETIEIYDWAIIELDKYGLFGETSIDDVRKIVLGPYYYKEKAEYIDRKISRYNEIFKESTNSNCLINGVIKRELGKDNYCALGIFQTFYSTFITLINHRISQITDLLIIAGLISQIIFYVIDFGEMFIPILPPCVIGLGMWCPSYVKPAKGWINTEGTLGKINTTGEFFGQFPLFQSIFSSTQAEVYYPGIFGYAGIQIYSIEKGRIYLLGYGLDVKLGRYRRYNIP
jgi:hypothetical protein